MSRYLGTCRPRCLRSAQMAGIVLGVRIQFSRKCLSHGKTFARHCENVTLSRSRALFPISVSKAFHLAVAINSNHVPSAALDNASRKAQKSANKNGNPIVLPSKILAIVTDDSEYQSQPAVFVAEGAGTVKRVRLDVRLIQSTHTHLHRTDRILARVNRAAKSPQYCARRHHLPRL